MVDVRGDVLRPPHGTTPAAVKANKIQKLSSFKSNENIHKREDGSYYVVPANKASSALSPKLGVVGISTLWHFRLPLPIQMFIKVASSPRLSGIGMPSPILWSHPLKMQRIVLLSSLLWWELGTNSLITGPGEWLSFRRFTSNYPDPDPDQWPCNDPATKARGNIMQFCEFQISSRFKDWYKFCSACGWSGGLVSSRISRFNLPSSKWVK